MEQRRLWKILSAAAPVMVLLWLYGPYVGAWFQKDDFAWLCLRNLISNGRSLAWTLFSPQAQGTVRFLSERLYFLVLTSIFGLKPAPFHIIALLVACLDATLIGILTCRMAGSRFAGFIASMFWVFLPAIVTPLTWVSAFNQLLCIAGVLGALVCLNSRRPYLVGAILCAIVAFGSNEAAVCVGLIVVAWAVIIDRTQLRISLLFLGMSAVYLMIHVLVVPLPSSGPYRAHLGLNPFWSLQWFWTASFEFATPAICAVVAIGVVGLCFLREDRQRSVRAFGLVAGLLALSPVLPFIEHRAPYYMSLPFAFLSIAIGSLAASRWKAVQAFTVTMVVVLILYEVPLIRIRRDWGYQRANNVEARYLKAKGEILAAHMLHPDSRLYVSGLDNELYSALFSYGSLRDEGVTNVYLVPTEAGRFIRMPREWNRSDDMALDQTGNALFIDVGPPADYDPR